MPAIAAGIGVAAFFCFMFSWVELLLAKTLTSVDAKPIAATMTRTASTSGYELGLLAAAGALNIVPGAFVLYFVRNYLAKGFPLARFGAGGDPAMGLPWMAWTWKTAVFFAAIALLLVGMSVWEWRSPGGAPGRGILGIHTTRGDRLFISLLAAAYVHL